MQLVGIKIFSYRTTCKIFIINNIRTIFGDFRVIAFFASIALLITTFFITKEITKKRVPGILAMLLVLQSNIF